MPRVQSAWPQCPMPGVAIPTRCRSRALCPSTGRAQCPEAAVERRPSASLAPGFTWDLFGRQARAGGIDGSDTDVVVERGRARRRLIPDIYAGAPRSPGRQLDGWIADHDIPPNPRIRRRREHDDAVRIPVGGVLLDQIVIARDDSDAEIVVGRREAISCRLVPPERVIASEDSNTAATGGGVSVPHGYICSKTDP